MYITDIKVYTCGRTKKREVLLSPSLTGNTILQRPYTPEVMICLSSIMLFIDKIYVVFFYSKLYIFES